MNHQPVFRRVINGDTPLSEVAKLLGWEFIAFDEKNQVIRVAYLATTLLTNPMKCIQGGILSAMLDDAMGPAIYYNLPHDQLAVTIESKTNFINPAYPGRIMGVGQIDYKKNSLIFTSGKLFDENKKVIATATATFQLGGLPKNIKF